MLQNPWKAWAIWSLLGMKEGLLSFSLNLEDEEDASKLHFPSSMRP